MAGIVGIGIKNTKDGITFLTYYQAFTFLTVVFLLNEKYLFTISSFSFICFLTKYLRLQKPGHGRRRS